MLPENLSNGICSLQPNEDRCSIICCYPRCMYEMRFYRQKGNGMYKFKGSVNKNAHSGAFH